MERCRCSCLGPSISSPRCLQSYPKSPCEIRKNSRSCSGCYGNVAAGVSQQLPGAGSRAWSPRGSPRCSPRRRSHPVLGLSPHRGLVLQGAEGCCRPWSPKPPSQHRSRWLPSRTLNRAAWRPSGYGGKAQARPGSLGLRASFSRGLRPAAGGVLCGPHRAWFSQGAHGGHARPPPGRSADPLGAKTLWGSRRIPSTQPTW